MAIFQNSATFFFLSCFLTSESGKLSRQNLLSLLIERYKDKEDAKKIFDDQIYKTMQKGFITKIEKGVYNITEKGLKELEDSKTQGIQTGYDWRR